MRTILVFAFVMLFTGLAYCQPTYDLTFASPVSCKQTAKDTMPDYQSELPGIDGPTSAISITAVCMCEYTLRGGVSPLYDTDRRDIVSRSLGTTGDPVRYCHQEVSCKALCPQEAH